MDSFELNKIIGALLGTLLFVMGVGFLAEAIYSPIEDRGPGYALAEAAAPGEEGGATAEAAPEVPLGVLLASADATAGAAVSKKCASCHKFTPDGANATGPGLYDVVDRLIGSHEGFAYSAGMEAHKAAGDLWTYENLNAFLTSPKDFTPGTKMNFAGLKNPEERANLLAYLQTLSASPKPFPAAEAAPAADAAAPAEGTEPAADAIAPADTAPVPTDADAIETPTTTGEETSVEGTPAPETTEAPAAP